MPPGTPPRRTVDVPFVGGYKQRDVPAWIDATSQTQALNAIWTKREAIEKRPGYVTAQLAIQANQAGFGAYAPTVLSADSYLMPMANGMAATDGTYLYNVDLANDAQLLDFVSPCVVSRLTVSSGETIVVNPDVGYYAASNLRIYVWQDGNSTNSEIHYAIVDGTTRTVMTGGTIDKNNLGVNPKVMVLGTWAYVFWHDTSGNVIFYASTNLATVVPGASWTTTSWITDIASGGQFDVAPSDNSANMALVYESSTGTTHMLVQQYSAAGGVLTQTWATNVPSTTGSGYRCVGIRYNGVNNRIWVAYEEVGSDAVKYITYVANNGTNLFSPVTVRGNTGNPVDHLGIEMTNATTACVVFGGTNGTESYVAWAVVQNAGNSGSVIQAPNTSWNVQLLSRPFAATTTDQTYPVRVYAWCATANIQMSNVLLEFDVNGLEPVPRPCAVSCPRTAWIGNTSQALPIRRNRSALTSVTPAGVPTATQFAAAGTVTLNQVESDVVASALVGCVDMLADFAHPGRFQTAQLNGLVYTGGGLPSVFDNTTLAETSTISEPCSQSPLATATDAGSGTLIATQTYSWVFVYAWRDRVGNIHRGQPSLPLAHTIGVSNQKVDLTIPSIYATKQGVEWRRSVFGDARLLIEVYRTYYDGASMSTTFYLAGSVENDVAAASTSYQDNLSDANLLAAATPLYTTGGVLENDMPSSFAAMTTHNSRIYGIGDDLRTIWISTQANVSDNTPVYFNDGLQLGVGGMGDLTAIWSMDDKLYIASATAIAYVTGGGPNNVGQQSDLSPPALLPTDVGVTDCRAVCVTPLGTVFRHALGLGLLDRSLAVRSDFGDSVIDLLATYPNVTGMSLHPTRPELLICANNGTTGIVLVYNYRFDRWSQWSIWDLDNSRTGLVSHSLAVSGSTMLMGTQPGRILREKISTDANQYYDALGGGKQWVTLDVESAWVKGGGLQSQGRVDEFQTLFTVLDWADVSVSVGYDYSTSYVSPGTWTISSDTIGGLSDVSGTLGSVTRFQWTPPTAQCSAFRIRWTDAPSSGSTYTSSTGQAFQLLGMSATILADDGGRRLPPGQGA